MSDRPTFGTWVHQQRHERGVSQGELAEYLGFSAALLRKLEAGERRPSGQIAELLADYFRIPSDERAAFVAFARTGQAAAGTMAPAADDGTPLTPWRSVYRRQTNLPALLAPLIGREREGATAHDQLRQPKTRLLTLTGPPGIGKTRLGLYVAAGLVDHFAEGVFFVDLAPLSDPALVLPTVARTLGLKEVGDRPIARVLGDYVGGRRMLLLLDNFEQVLDGAPAVVQLLEASPWLKVLVTSREALHVRGERRFPVPPLGLPNPQHLPPVAGLSGYPAVALFVDRAQAVDPAFALTEETAADVAAVCIALAGVPLAIELAAGRASHLALPALRQALSSHLTLLAGGARDLPTRQQTLRAAIAWSYDLLAEHEQHLFRALGVFVGGFPADALDGIGAGRPAAPVSPLATLLSLTDKHLVQEDRPTAPSRGGRFGLLEAVREYALEQLAQHGETAEVRGRHAAYYLALAEQAEPHLRGPQAAHWLEWLEREHDNLRAALGWAGAHDPATALRGAAALAHFWEVRGYWSEGRAHLTAALAGAVRLDPAIAGRDRARVLHGAGLLALSQGDDPTARSLLEQSLREARQCGDGRAATNPLRTLGHLARGGGDLAAARDLYEQSLALSRELGYTLGSALALHELGTVAVLGADYAAARALFEDALILLQELGGQRRNIAYALCSLGRLAGYEGDYPAARALLEQGLAHFHALGEKGASAETNLDQGAVALWQGDYPAARAWSAQGLALSQEVGDRRGAWRARFQRGSIAYAEGDYASAGLHFRQALAGALDLGDTVLMAKCLAGLGAAAVGQGLPGGAQRGGRLLGAAARLLVQGATMSPWERRDHEQWLATAHTALGDGAFETAFAAGQALPFEQAVALAADA